MTQQSAGLVGDRETGQAGRLYYLDWLRVLAILMVFFVHCAKIFDYHTTGVYNAVRSPFWSAFREFNFLWVMPLFFVISGAAVLFALKPDRAWPFFKTRINRLVIPLVVVGTFLINPLYVYAERLFGGQAGGFFQWYPRFFEGMYGWGGNFAPLGHGTHLWYLEFLFIYTLILLPFFIRSKKRIAGGMKTLSSRFEHPFALLLLFLPISVSGAGLEMLGLGGMRVIGGWDPVSYLFFFLFGFMMYSNGRILATITKHGPVFLAAAVILTVLHVDSHFGFNLVVPGITRHDMAADGALRPLVHSGWVAVQAFRGLIAWCWVLGLLGTGSRLLTFNPQGLSYANEAVLPFYILHHSVILVIGVYIVQWNSGVGIKFFSIAVISFAVIMVVYDLLVRRVRFIRFLFGMKMKKQGAA